MSTGLLLAAESSGHDPRWAILAGAFGLLAGFQSVYQRYSEDSLRLIFASLSGFFYMITRGAIPAGLFLAIPEGEVANFPPWMVAMGLGAGAELVLRMRFFVGEKKAENGTEDLLIGPFDLLKWYQEIFLLRMGIKVGKWRQASAVAVIPADKDFTALVADVRTNIPNLSRLQTEVGNAVTAVENQFAAAGNAADEELFKRRLAFKLRSILSLAELKQLFA